MTRGVAALRAPKREEHARPRANRVPYRRSRANEVRYSDRAEA